MAEVIHLGGFPQNLTLPKVNVAEYREAMRAVVSALIKALKDDDARVASWAALALSEAALEPGLAVPALIASLRHTDVWVRRGAAQALGNFGNAAQAAVPALIQLRDNAQDYASSDARQALEKIAPKAK